ncbi:MAG: hypothetical protein ABW168_18900 [Sedimenticola sp.]
MIFSHCIFEGVKAAFIAPFIAILAVALGDFDMLRDFLVHADGGRIRFVVAQIMMAGFVFGSLLNILSLGKHNAAENIGISALGSSGVHARWYWALKKDGRDLSIRESTTSRCIPTADVKWGLEDLITELSRITNKTGSDLLDRKVAKALGMRGKLLRPTQRIDDAIQLLLYRYHGHQSQYQWDVKTENTESGYRAYVMIRQGDSDDWMRCLVADGPSKETAITIAAITRETWSFTT